MNRLARSVVLLLVTLAGCTHQDPVTIVASKLVYHAGGPIGFGSGNPFGVEIHLKTSRPSKGVTVTFIADGMLLETKSVEVLNGVSSSFEVDTRRREFTHGKARYVEVVILTAEGTSSGPHKLSVPKPQTDF